MLTGRFEAIPGEGTQVTPSTWHSMSDSFKAAFQTPFLIMPQTSDERKNLWDNIQGLQMASNAGEQGLVQKSANWFSGLVGGALNPISLGTGEVAGALASKGITAGAGLIGRYIPVSGAVVATGVAQKTLGSFLGKEVPNFVGNTTIGQLGKGTVMGLAIGTGFSLPQEIAETFNPKDDSFNWWGGIKSSFADGGIGLGLMAVPFLGGTLWGKMFRGASKEVSHSEMPLPHEAKNNDLHPALQKIDEAEQNKKLSSDEAQWFRDYLQGNVDNKALTDKAIELLIKDGHPVDSATKRVLFSIFKPEDIDQLQTAIADRLANVSPENIKPLLTKFMINGKLDEFRGNTKMLDGLQGVVSFIKKRLDMQPEEMINLHKILRRFLPENMKEENPFSQHKVYKAAKAKKSIGVTTPEHVERLLKNENKIRELRNKVANYEKAFKQTGKNRFQNLRQKAVDKLIELEQNKPALLSHQEEIKHLREKLLSNGKVKNNFKVSREYQRLSDLTRVRNDARKLMHELHVTHEYEMHGHYAEFLDAITKVMRSSMGQLADHNNVLNYMKERLIRQIPDFDKIETFKAEDATRVERVEENIASQAGEKAESNKAFKDDVVKEMDESMKDAPSEIAEEFDKTKAQFNEFNEQQGVLKNLIKCVQGSLNV